MKKVIVKYYGENNSILTDEHEADKLECKENAILLVKGSNTIIAILSLHNIISVVITN